MASLAYKQGVWELGNTEPSKAEARTIFRRERERGLPMAKGTTFSSSMIKLWFSYITTIVSYTQIQLKNLD